eukprot:scaffold7309_cov18-Tisochrysis_lutea.AAC.1
MKRAPAACLKACVESLGRATAMEQAFAQTPQLGLLGSSTHGMHTGLGASMWAWATANPFLLPFSSYCTAFIEVMASVSQVAQLNSM